MEILSLKNKISIVTGGGSGIGRAIAEKLSSLGSTVIIFDVSEEGGLSTVREINSKGGSSYFFKVDVSNEESVKRGIENAVEKTGGIDVLVNNAGIEPPSKSLLELSVEEYDRVLNINLKGVWLMTKYATPYIAKRGGGSVINIASVAGIMPLAGAMPYSVSKAGVIMLTKVSAVELGKLKIRVNAIAPGWVDTPMIERAARNLKLTPEEFKKINSQRIILGRFASPEEIANAVAFLASDESSYITGSLVVVDGGISIT
ncbi:short chain dehydrogenase [Fervidicoccus fontis Kam940]|uniref:Short chain dehydrogenase n=1 Tax=Fervidicoccus fontis (strain DSM 19380 / JCM 18336 / VKM B-2539 / Kam940) TaxID=1163730 RepID=I0A138_FERFK|nr:short chain dehydrogenase [Fervidicoccus fontis Kam940]